MDSVVLSVEEVVDSVPLPVEVELSVDVEALVCEAPPDVVSELPPSSTTMLQPLRIEAVRASAKIDLKLFFIDFPLISLCLSRNAGNQTIVTPSSYSIPSLLRKSEMNFFHVLLIGTASLK